MTAAVADYRPVRAFSVLKREVESEAGKESWLVQDVHAGKVKSTHKEIAILGEPTEKIVDLFRTEWRFEGLLVKFKLEVGISKDELLKIGQASRIASGADYLVANTLEMVEGENAGAFLIGETGNRCTCLCWSPFLFFRFGIPFRTRTGIWISRGSGNRRLLAQANPYR